VRGIGSAVLASAELVAQLAPKDLGNLKRSCRAAFQHGSGYVIVDAPYTGIVGTGARPHWTPICRSRTGSVFEKLSEPWPVSCRPSTIAICGFMAWGIHRESRTC
jgi:hypothetical protein